MSTYNSVLDVTAEIASTMKKSQLKDIATEEIMAIDNKFEAEGKFSSLAGTAKKALASGLKDMKKELANKAMGCLNMLLPFAALGHFKAGNKKIAIVQVVLCCLALIIPMCAGSVAGGVVGCYVVGILYNFALMLWNKVVEIKNQAAQAAKDLANLSNPYHGWKALHDVEHFTAEEHYNAYIALLDEREAHYLQIVKLCK